MCREAVEGARIPRINGGGLLDVKQGGSGRVGERFCLRDDCCERLLRWRSDGILLRWTWTLRRGVGRYEAC